MWSCVHEGVNHELLSSSPGFLGEIDFLEFKEGARWCCTRPIPFTMRHMTPVPLGPSEPTPRPSQGYGQKAPCRNAYTKPSWGMGAYGFPCKYSVSLLLRLLGARRLEFKLPQASQSASRTIQQPSTKGSAPIVLGIGQ